VCISGERDWDRIAPGTVRKESVAFRGTISCQYALGASMITPSLLLLSSVAHPPKSQSPQPLMNNQERLPLEIIECILQFCPPSFVSKDVESHSFPQYSPLLVSKSWNSFVLSTPSLWATISMESRQLFYPQVTPRLIEWLKRGKECMLDISITSEEELNVAEELPGERPLYRKDWRTNFSTMAPTSARWKSFTFWFTSPREMEPVFSCLKHSDKLRHLDIVSYWSFHDKRVATLASASSPPPNPVFPNLRVLRLGGGWHVFTPSDIALLSAACVTSFTLFGSILTFEIFRLVCCSMPNLQELKMEALYFRWHRGLEKERIWNPEKANEPSLRKLWRLDLDCPYYLPRQILNCSSSLSSLVLGWDAAHVDGCSMFFDSLENSPTSIRSLEIRCHNGRFTLDEHVSRLSAGLRRLVHLQSVTIEQRTPAKYQKQRRTEPSADISALLIAARQHPNTMAGLEICTKMQ
jgi:hypothetical protein